MENFSSLNGVFRPPGDKSISHRIALMSIIAKGRCHVQNYSTAEDCQSSLRVFQALGGVFAKPRGAITINGLGGMLRESAELNCGNSGTTMRLVMGILSSLKGDFVVDGDLSLRRRPMERVAVPLRLMGAQIDLTPGKTAPVAIRGRSLTGISYRLPLPSAQLKSAVLLAGSQAKGLTTVIEPKRSRDHTERMLRLLGADITEAGESWIIQKSQLRLPNSLYVPGDPSSAAFFLCAAAVMPQSEVTAESTLLNETRLGFLNVLKRMGADVQIVMEHKDPEDFGSVNVKYSPVLRGVEVKADEIPFLIDEVPILCLVATQAEGSTVFRDVKELKVKESDRVNALVTQLGQMGAILYERDNDLFVEGPTPLKVSGGLDSFGDHRIAMTLKLAGRIAGVDPQIRNYDSVSISYPGFNRDLEALST
jgi:3-phosphoshikimate 1-carboxyvinyltransferase